MSYGLISVADKFNNNAMTGLADAAKREQAREIAGDQIEAADKAARASAVGTGAGLGMIAGMQAGAIGGPAGMAVGAAAGYLAYELL
jgi:hypothetical protein|tara:strand:+ start:1183 stop:1443 length:261 start_codon:yes stop_codon:yes gene_type:complete